MTVTFVALSRARCSEVIGSPQPNFQSRLLQFSGPAPAESRQQRRNAFTLIELLVAIAIIALLAAILFPVFARARENARRTSCMSNLKQIGLGVLQYTQDFDERLPGHYTSAAMVWANRLDPYIKSRQIFFCPSAPDEWYNPANPITSSNLSYGYNYLNLSAGTSGEPAGNGRLLAEIQKPAETVAITDTGDRPSFRYIVRWDGETFTPSYGVSKLHLDGTNAAFLDGHAKWYPVPGDLTKDGSLWDRS